MRRRQIIDIANLVTTRYQIVSRVVIHVAPRRAGAAATTTPPTKVNTTPKIALRWKKANCRQFDAFSHAG